MIYSVGIKKMAHLLETGTPPGITVMAHSLPVISGKAPILSLGGESIGWSPCLSVKMKQLRLSPGRNTVPADAYGNISFQNDFLFTGIFMSTGHLPEKKVLHKSIKGSCGFHFAQRVVIADFPDSEIGSTVGITQGSKQHIVRQPVPVLTKKIPRSASAPSMRRPPSTRRSPCPPPWASVAATPRSSWPWETR